MKFADYTNTAYAIKTCQCGGEGCTVTYHVVATFAEEDEKSHLTVRGRHSIDDMIDSNGITICGLEVAQQNRETSRVTCKSCMMMAAFANSNAYRAML